MADASETPDGPDAAEPSAPRAPAMPKGSLSRFVMIFLFLLAFWTLFDPQLAQIAGNAASAVLTPLLGFNAAIPVITILLAGMFTTTLSSIVRDYFTNWVRQARTQKIMRAWSRERMDAVRKGNKARLEQLMEAQKGFQQDQMALMFSPYKSMALTMFVFIVMFSWLRTFVDFSLSANGNQFIAVPWSSNVWLPSIYVFPSWVLLYSLLAIPFGQIVSRVMKYVRFRRRLREMGLPLRAEPDRA
ncbi:MAG: hypothetical protein A3K66_05530 [Euryarchaeota archaeon RBG_16_67_27]|nr:MAG: hypothetical protein A3K66_05530 [Euryarchaeota archaeon RBG_16_67_27]